MRLGVNTVDIFSGDHIALNVRPELNEFTLVDLVKRTHRELGVDVVELPAKALHRAFHKRFSRLPRELWCRLYSPSTLPGFGCLLPVSTHRRGQRGEL